MKMKKYLSFVLALCLVFSMASPAFADENTAGVSDGGTTVTEPVEPTEPTEPTEPLSLIHILKASFFALSGLASSFFRAMASAEPADGTS